jgi:hypothetical protein
MSKQKKKCKKEMKKDWNKGPSSCGQFHQHFVSAFAPFSFCKKVKPIPQAQKTVAENFRTQKPRINLGEIGPSSHIDHLTDLIFFLRNHETKLSARQFLGKR